MRHHPVRVGAPRDIVPPPSLDVDDAAGAAAEERRGLRRIDDRGSADGRRPGVAQDEARGGAEHGAGPQAVPAAAAAVSPRRDRSVVRHRGHAAHRSGQGRFRRARAAPDPRRRGRPSSSRRGSRATAGCAAGCACPAHRTGGAAGRHTGWRGAPSARRSIARSPASRSSARMRCSTSTWSRCSWRRPTSASKRRRRSSTGWCRHRAPRSPTCRWIRRRRSATISVPGSAAFTEHLVDPLRGQPMTFVLGGEIDAPRLVRSGRDAGRGQAARPCPRATGPRSSPTSGATGMKRFILLLRQLASEFDAFGDSAEGRAVFAELETIRLPLMLRPIRDRAAHGRRRQLSQAREPRPARARSGRGAVPRCRCRGRR